MSFLMAITPAERAAKVRAGKDRIAAAERKRQEAKAARIAKKAKKRGKS